MAKSSLPGLPAYEPPKARIPAQIPDGVKSKPPTIQKQQPKKRK